MSSPLPSPSKPPLSPTSSFYGSYGGSSSSANVGGSSSRNPISSKVSAVLSTNFDDEGTLAALETLSQFGLDGDNERRGGGGGGWGSISGRGGLRTEVDRRMMNGSKKFLKSFSEVNEKLETLQSHLDEMHKCCDEVESKLQAANEGTKYLLTHAEGLRQQRASTALKQSIVTVFLARFTLSEADLRAINSREVPVGRELFRAMDKTEAIRKDCRVLLSGEGGESTKAGLDIMEATSQYLETGYQKIFRWCSFQVRGYTKDAVVEVSGTVREAMKRLKNRPDLFKEVLDLLGTSRSSSILALFLDALVRGGPNGLPRPIELHAHDPLRYIGDMLAWIHQTMAGEREFLESLFGMKEDGRWVGSVRVWTKTEDERGRDEEKIRELLDKDMEGCGRPLKLRVQQTIKSQEGPIMSYRIANLIQFYGVLLQRTAGEDALISKVLHEIMDNAFSAFYDTLEAQGRSLLRFIQPPAVDLSPPLTLRDALSTLREIMQVYETSSADSADVPQVEDRETGFDRVLKMTLDPALDMCKKMSDLRASGWDKAVYGINCLEFIKSVLEPFSFTQKRRDSLTEEMKFHEESLTAEHYAHLLTESGLEPILEALQSKDADTPLSHLPQSSSRVLSTSIRTFDKFLSTIDVLMSPRLALLSSPRQASHIHRMALQRIVEAYGKVWEAVMDERNKYEFRTSVMSRNREEVGLLLGDSSADDASPAKLGMKT